jgi:membrane-associated phospholipid phosphatase
METAHLRPTLPHVIASTMSFITDFADQAVILPLVLAIGIALLAQGWRRGAVAWVVVVVATFATVLGLKLAFLACSQTFGTTNLHTPSGHVAAAAVVTGGLATLLLGPRASVLLLAALVAAVIGLSRLVLGAHSVPEVMLGAMVGLVGTGALQWLAGSPPPDLNMRRIVVIAMAVVLLFHGLHFPAEAHIRATAFRFAQVLSVCQSSDVRL